jgi:glycosyltransferase involved in cell wall biosynthesis
MDYKMITLSIVVPCYNEEAALPKTNDSLLALISKLTLENKVSRESRIYYVDDGSKDNTWSHIENYASNSEYIEGIKLSRNCGHQNALLAGLFSVPGDAVISIDADLQDDISAMEQMTEEFLSGVDIVYGVRIDRSTDSFFKRFTAGLYYKILRSLGVEVIHNHADYRLMSRRAIEALKEFPEVNVYVRGLIPLVGFRSSLVFYKREPRTAGESKYPFRKMLSLAWQGVTSMSIVPLRIVTATGIMVFALSMLLSLFIVSVKLFTDRALPGWASTVLPIYLLGGVQILCVGILGEYMGKIYLEVKSRPRYIIEKTTTRK